MNEAKAVVKFNDVLRMVCHHGEVTQGQVRGRSRLKKHAMCRHMIMFLARKWTCHSLSEIGGLLGGRDHSTVMWGVEKIEKMLAKNNRHVTLLSKLVELDLGRGVHRGELTDLEVVDMDPHGEQGDVPPYVKATYKRPDGSRWMFTQPMTRIHDRGGE